MNLKEWGYTWDGMEEITREQAKKQYKEKETFILYDDDTESLIESEEQFNIKGVRYDVEKEGVNMLESCHFKEVNSNEFNHLIDTWIQDNKDYLTGTLEELKQELKEANTIGLQYTIHHCYRIAQGSERAILID